MIRRLILCTVIIGILVLLGGCGEQTELREEDMVNAKWESITILSHYV